MPAPSRSPRLLGRTERRVIAAILLTAAIPLLGSILVARAVIARISATAFQNEFSEQLDRSLEVYADLVKAIKATMKAEADAISASAELRAAARVKDAAAIERELGAAFAAHPTLVELRAEAEDGTVVLARRARGKPVDAEREKTLEVRRELGVPFVPPSHSPGELEASPIVLVATFATPNDRLVEMDAAQQFAQSYKSLASKNRDAWIDDSYRNLFAAVVGLTVAVAFAVGVAVARPTVRRITRLAVAMRPVAEGDLSVRVDPGGADEVGDLGRSFNRMLEELEQSRARIEFLRRIGEWQKMARRLAHEIKNPLTPILLAVEECHRRYTGDDPEYRRIVQTTLEVVGEEVGTLRRLVSEFSSFARLPRAELANGDLAALLRDEREHLEARASRSEIDDVLAHADVTFEVPEGELPMTLDREMLHRALSNVVRNAAQALRDAGRHGKVVVRVRTEGDWYVVDVDDDGPGIPKDVAATLFDPYVTTKKDGTGLGLAIVKKIAVDHGGDVAASSSPLGGARFRFRLPRPDTAAARAALERAASHDDREGGPASR